MANGYIFLGHISDVTTTVSAGDSIYHSLNSGGETRIELINTHGQTIAAITSASQVAMPGVAPVAIINSSTNAVAGWITVHKISVDYSQTEGINHEDIVSLIGNVSGIALNLTALAGLRLIPNVGIVLTAFGIVA
ncbi:hypothetical protein [Halotalea alkalilenta]|uniref:hypothetical protein n=1 Tax=Halotalea alkalilenta TaxID=376489 RepID=UPI0012DECD9C|nr:hypothetical protein [Halotalea alkalilenta]